MTKRNPHKHNSEKTVRDIRRATPRQYSAYIWGLPIIAMYPYTEAMGSKVDGINQLYHN